MKDTEWNPEKSLGPQGGERAKKDSGLLFQSLDLVLDVLPHMAVEGKGQFTEGAGQHSSLK
jgi:hypothetical protein